VLVGFHMLGAALISAAMTWVLLTVREQPGARAAGGHDRVRASGSDEAARG
jgi:hypothetical protein